METLTHICEEADNTLSFLEVEKGKLEKEVKDWIDEEMKIIAHKASVKNQNLIIMVEEVQDFTKLPKYSVLRFFVGGGNWHTSVDLQYKNKEEAFQFLLNHYE